MLATLGLLATTAILSPVPGRADTRYPVLLVHGRFGFPGDFEDMIERLSADGYRSYTVDVRPGTHIVPNAGRISAKVDEIRATTGASKVHLVGHNMGGLSARYYIKIMGGLSNVATYTAFGTPQHGHPPGCPWVPDQCPQGPILRTLNRGDDTPGSIHYTSIASTGARDNPDEVTGKWHPLDQGACLPEVDGGLHDDEARNAEIYQAVKDGLNSSCPSGWTNLPDITP